ncbi:MAG: hypothetical protein AB1634_09205 [Thermodesulfobacteriota bacterium]
MVVLACGMLVLPLLCPPTSAAFEVREGRFQLELVSPTQAQWDRDQNDGFNNSWYMYPQQLEGMALDQVALPWWNEWWWNDPYRIGGKWVQIQFDWSPIDPNMPVQVGVTINWTNGGWVGQQGPPIPGQGYDAEQYIERLHPWELMGNGGHFDSGLYWLPIHYNPEWVSVDVRGGNVLIANGQIWHQCVPLPGAVWLLGSGLLGLVGLRRRLIS